MIGDAILPAWVEREDIDRKRAIDALGLQSFADELADYILPGLSVATWRARYISFFCWVRQRISGAYSEHKIHQWEIALALVERGEHGDRSDECAYVGSRGIAKYMRHQRIALSSPTLVYKTPAWRAYRPTLIDLGLVEDRKGWPLTDTGDRIARLYDGRGKARGPLRLADKACLSCMSMPEQRRLRALIGLSNEVRNPTEHLMKRREFIRELRRRFSGNTVPPIGTFLDRYETIHGNRNPQLLQRLNAATAWEWLSLGLNALFVAWVKTIGRGNDEAAFRTAFCSMLASTRETRQHLGEIELSDQGALLRNALSALRHARRLKRQPNPVLERTQVNDMFNTAAELLVSGMHSRRNRVDQFLANLGNVHQDTKGEDSWIEPVSNGRWILTDSQARLPDIIRLHSYRVSAFGRIVHDLGGLHA